MIFMKKFCVITISRYHDITINNEYLVISIEYEYYRIINENAEPCLYEQRLFEITDSSIPLDWIREEKGDNDYCFSPLEFVKEKYFFERYFDREPKILEIFNKYINELKKYEH